VKLALTAVAAAIVLASCGSDNDDKAAAPTSSTPKHAEATATPRSADEKAVAKAAQKYIDGLVSRDFALACESRTKRDKASLAKVAGTCERALEAIVAEKPGLRTLLKDAHPGKVTVTGNTAKVEILQPGQKTSENTFAALKENGRWGLRSGD
jgi:hypothetical protein